MKKHSYGVVSAIFHCEDCGWEPSNYRNGQATAAIHAKSHGHRVSGEITLAFCYDGKE